MKILDNILNLILNVPIYGKLFNFLMKLPIIIKLIILIYLVLFFIILLIFSWEFFENFFSRSFTLSLDFFISLLSFTSLGTLIITTFCTGLFLFTFSIYKSDNNAPMHIQSISLLQSFYIALIGILLCFGAKHLEKTIIDTSSPNNILSWLPFFLILTGITFFLVGSWNIFVYLDL